MSQFTMFLKRPLIQALNQLTNVIPEICSVPVLLMIMRDLRHKFLVFLDLGETESQNIWARERVGPLNSVQAITELKALLYLATGIMYVDYGFMGRLSVEV